MKNKTQQTGETKLRRKGVESMTKIIFAAILVLSAAHVVPLSADPIQTERWEPCVYPRCSR